MADMVFIKISEAYFTNVYAGKSWADDEPPKFGLSIKAEELPNELRPWAHSSRDREGWELINIRSRWQPQVVCTGSDTLAETLARAGAANLKVDDLFLGVPMEMAVERIEFESTRKQAHATRHSAPEMVRMLAVRAIRVDGDLLAKRYEELCAQFWLGA